MSIVLPAVLGTMAEKHMYSKYFHSTSSTLNKFHFSFGSFPIFFRYFTFNFVLFSTHSLPLIRNGLIELIFIFTYPDFVCDVFQFSLYSY